MIVAEIDKDDEKLEHRWYFDELPAGDQVLHLVGARLSVLPKNRSIVEFKTEIGEGACGLVRTGLAMATPVSYEGVLALSEPTTLEVRIKLPGGVKAGEDLAQTRLELDFIGVLRAD